MPYGISQQQSDCATYATVKQESDGTYTTIGCHQSKQDAIDQMVVVSMAEDVEPLGEIRALDDMIEGESEIETEIDDDEYDLTPRQSVMYEALEQIAEQYGMWSQASDADGCDYQRESPDAAIGRMCAHCAFYEGDGMCHIVEGDIAPEGICRFNVIPDRLLQEQPSDEIDQAKYEMRAEVDLSAPEFMRASARRGLRLHEQGLSGDGLMPATVADARRMADGEVSEGKWRKIGAWIARHLVDLEAVDGDEITAGQVAMLLWGGGSTKATALRAQRYAEQIVTRLDAEQRADPPAPPKDQIIGSDKNEPLSAQGKTGNIVLSAATETALQNKVQTHNDEMKEADKPEWSRVSLGALKSVYRRGAGAFSASHRPNVSRAQWAMARVNAFLYLSKNGRPQNPKYITDNDLLKPSHPKYSKSSSRAANTDMATMIEMTDDLASMEHRWCVTGADERRVAYTTMEFREMGDGNHLVGYAAVFDSPSEPMPFTEYVKRGAFQKTIKDGADVRLLIDHEGVPLARTKSGTLMLEEDERGLKVTADLDPANPDAARVISAMRRGDMSQMSFAFRTIQDSWSSDRSVRELREVQLFDVSVVTFPAYEETIAELRTAQSSSTVTSTTSVSVRKAQIALARQR
jgi:HK97 family phage prohead protease